ncbi:MAG: DUF429 domain-containing protein [Rhodobacteraceae bacterium]|nr:DUF429 domain-containing protein [Paracoccaceae bacterium]
MDQIDLVTPQRSTVIFGFDSAWTDAPRAPGAICAITVEDRGDVRFHEPRLASFAQARAFIDGLRKGFAVSLVALDQPTVVPNATGSRPVDKVAASLVSFVGGGVQPANRSKTGMFCDDAPIWAFLSAVDATQDPLRARTASAGHFVIEVFPALALPALEDGFAGRLRAPKYNPQNRKKFRLEDWQAVAVWSRGRPSALGCRALPIGPVMCRPWANRGSLIRTGLMLPSARSSALVGARAPRPVRRCWAMSITAIWSRRFRTRPGRGCSAQPSGARCRRCTSWIPRAHANHQLIPRRHECDSLRNAASRPTSPPNRQSCPILLV